MRCAHPRDLAVKRGRRWRRRARSPALLAVVAILCAGAEARGTEPQITQLGSAPDIEQPVAAGLDRFGEVRVIGWDYHPSVTISRYRSGRWLPKQALTATVSEFLSNNAQIRFASNQDGLGVLAWDDGKAESVTGHIALARSGAGFRTTMQFPAGFGGGPVLVNSRGDALVVDSARRGGVLAAFRSAGSRGFKRPVRLPGGSGVPDAHAVLSHSGAAVVAWAPDLFFLPKRPLDVNAAVKRADSSFGPTQLIARNVSTWTLASNARGDALLLWRFGHRLYARLLAAGARRFSSAKLVSANDGRGDIFAAVDARGGAVVAWQGIGDGTVRTALRSPGGSFQHEHVLTTTAPHGFIRMTFTANSRGGAAVAWFTRSPTGQLIAEGSTRAAGGAFAPAERWSRSGEPSISLGLVVAEDGTVAAVWVEADVLPALYEGSGPLDAATWKAGARFVNPRTIAPNACACFGFFNASLPLAELSTGRLLVTFLTGPNPLTASVDVILDDHGYFTQPESLLADVSWTYGGAVAFDGRGDAVIAARNDRTSGVRAALVK